MVKHLLTVLFLFALPLASLAQYRISGTIVDEKQMHIQGASIYLDGTLDGASTDSLGKFSFTTTETGPRTLVASAVGYSTAGSPLDITKDITGIALVLKNTAKTLEEVVILAGAFEASNDKDKTVLKPLDIVTTAGTQADVVRAIETLPGTQKQGAQNGLFVRGGDASEASYIVDGLTVQNAFFSGPPGVATRSRFGAFQYKGVSFSSGGYSARYGQALSSVLELSTTDLSEQSTINLGANMAGVYASGSKPWKKSGGDVSVNYTNLQPFYGLIKTNVDYYEVPTGGGASARYAWQPSKNSLFKIIVAGSQLRAGIGIPDSADQQIRYGMKNALYTANATYRQSFKDKFTLLTAVGYSNNKDGASYGGIPINNEDQRLQGRLEGKLYLTSRFNLLLGGELQHIEVDNKFASFPTVLDEDQVAGYLEMEWTPVYWLALKPGIRYEHSKVIDKATLSPRLAMAIKAGRNGQVSLASGIFYQNPDIAYLTIPGFSPTALNYQKAIHYIANYQWQKSDRTLRIEGYYKDYQSLIKENGERFNPAQGRSVAQDLDMNPGSYVDNSGTGYATGAELFWRDKKSIKNTDYWISYSYIDSRRLYKNLPIEATPDFIATHNLNIIGKYWIEKLQTQINVTYSYASGRPYYFPVVDSTPFTPITIGSGTTPDYHNLSFTINHLRTIGKWFTVIYAGIDNATNHQNIFGYRFNQEGKMAHLSDRRYTVPSL